MDYAWPFILIITNEEGDMKTVNHIKQLFLLLGWCLVFLLISISAGYAADKLDQAVDEILAKKFTGDFPEIKERRVIRALVPYSKTFYFLDRAEEKGATYELLKHFEKDINEKLKTKYLKVHVIIIPTSRDKLISGLVDGTGDIAAGNLTITKGRLEQVDFADPIGKGVNEIVITGPGAPKVASLDDLSGKSVHVRPSSSYYESLVKLNETFKAKGKEPVSIVTASTYLEDEDLLEMVQAGLIPMTVVDNYKARLWAQIFPDIKLHEDIKVNTGGEIAWAIRKNSPELKKVINQFVSKNKKGTLIGNIIFNRYLKNTKFIKNNLAANERKRMEDTIAMFQKYGEKYSFDWLMLAALAYQESTIDQSKRSNAGAIGVMQILPSTAKDKNVNIPNIVEIDPNIEAGTKYIRFMVDRYFNDPKLDELNRGLFAFASYNAGPAKVARLRKEAAATGLDPNVWFRNVEVIAAKRIGRETVQYVGNIFKYYTAYKLIKDQFEHKQSVKKAQE